MAETPVEDARQSRRSRLGRSIQGVLAGVLLFVVGFPLLWWNEGRAVRAARLYREGTSQVVSVDPEVVKEQNEGRLVHVTGVATTGEIIRDPQFGVSVRALRLRRTVEMYQWREEARSGDPTAPSGSGDRVASTTSCKVWSARLVDSSGFASPLEHANPTSMPVQSREWVVGRATVGAFTLSSELVLQVDRFEPVRPEALPPGGPHGLKLHDGGFYLGVDPELPEVGDLRVRFKAVFPVTVSVVALQERSRLEPHRAGSGRALDMLEVGAHGAEEMFAAALNRNRTATWLLRLAGAVLLFVGLATALRPLADLADAAPRTRAVLRLGLGPVAAVAAVSSSLVTMAAAWIAYRPLVGLAMAAVAAGVAGIAWRLGGARYPGARR